MSKNLYPGANATAQYFANKFRGSTMAPDVAVVHTTEGFTWPGYGGGASAPNMTVLPDIKAKKLYFRQHFPANKSSRALENRAGGVQTNTQNAFQFELVGTCDSRYKTRWGSLRAGIDYIYWPDAPDWALKQLGEAFKWLNKEWALPLRDGALRGWAAYPASYGLNAKQRMSFGEWNKSKGIVGHQHVPENSHGDPGNFPIKRFLALLTGSAAPAPTPAPAPVVPKPAAGVLDTLTTMTYNVVAEVAHTGLASWKVRVPHAVAFVDDAKPDVLFIQEAGDAKTHKPMQDQLHDIGYTLLILSAWRAIYYRRARIERNAKWRTGVKVLDGPKIDGVEDTKATVYGLLRFRASKRAFWAIDTHLSYRDQDGAWRLRQGVQLRELRSELHKVKAVPTVLGGDLNSSAEVVNAFVAAGWNSGTRAGEKIGWDFDSYNALETTPRKNKDHIDHVLSYPGGGLEFVPVRWEQYGNIKAGKYVKPIPSDHNPVLVEWDLVAAK